MCTQHGFSRVHLNWHGLGLFWTWLMVGVLTGGLACAPVAPDDVGGLIASDFELISENGFETER